jgi:hypothetical protein
VLLGVAARRVAEVKGACAGKAFGEDDEAHVRFYPAVRWSGAERRYCMEKLRA